MIKCISRIPNAIQQTIRYTNICCVSTLSKALGEMYNSDTIYGIIQFAV